MFAGQMGVGMVFAEFIARTDAGPAVGAYRRAFRPSSFRTEPWAGIALIAYAAETAEQAWREDAMRRAANVSMLSGRRRRFPDLASAETFLNEHRRHAGPAVGGSLRTIRTRRRHGPHPAG